MALTVVEMAGMVGAGKTTLASAVAEELEDRGDRVLEPREAIAEVLDRSAVGTLSRRLLRSRAARCRMFRAIYRTVVRPWWFRPPDFLSGSRSERSGFVRVMSEKSETDPPRRPGLVGL